MKQLSSDQIKELHKLVERSAVGHYDVQVEIVDHYASAIEAIWAADPNITFYQAQVMIYKEFWDFQGLVEDKKKILYAKANKGVLEQLKTIFYWPTILKFIVLTSLIYFTFPYFNEGMYANQETCFLLIGGMFFYPLVPAFSIMFYAGYLSIKVNRFEKNCGLHFLRLHAIYESFSMYPMIIAWSCSFWGIIIFNNILLFSLCFAISIILMQGIHTSLKNEIVLLKKQFT